MIKNTRCLFLLLGALALSRPLAAQTPAGSRQQAGIAVKDTDGDGVPDDKDECPSAAGPALNNGCPVAAAEQPAPLQAVATMAPAKAAPGATLLYETFDDNRRQWPIAPVTGGKEVQADIISGAYQGITGTKQTLVALVPVPLDAGKPFTITLATQVIMNLFRDGYGLAFGADKSKNMYLLLLNSEQQFCIMKIADGASSFPVPWTIFKQLNPKGSNVISVKRAGDSWYVYLNGIQAYVAKAASFFGDGIGIMQAGDQVVRYDELLVRSFDAGVTAPVVGPKEGRFLRAGGK